MSRVGSFIIGLKGLVLTSEEREWLQHPLVVGVILFTRNYHDKAQLLALTESIRSVKEDLLITVDHEGGRVQRFREGFTRVPAMNVLETLYSEDPKAALQQSYEYGRTIASELKECGVDFSYAPVCDLNYGNNVVIGDRSFHSDALSTAHLVRAFYQGLRVEGSIGVAKHFPGHGYVAIDTHLGIAYDDRPFSEIVNSDLLPFKILIDDGIEAIMPAHIVYSDFDSTATAVSSVKWINYLRDELGFKGLIISDDLDMKGADHLGDTIQKAQCCFDAGIDVLLCCNDFVEIGKVLSGFADQVMDDDVKHRLAVIQLGIGQ